MRQRGRRFVWLLSRRRSCSSRRSPPLPFLSLHDFCSLHSSLPQQPSHLPFHPPLLKTRLVAFPFSPRLIHMHVGSTPPAFGCVSGGIVLNLPACRFLLRPRRLGRPRGGRSRTTNVAISRARMGGTRRSSQRGSTPSAPDSTATWRRRCAFPFIQPRFHSSPVPAWFAHDCACKERETSSAGLSCTPPPLLTWYPWLPSVILTRPDCLPRRECLTQSGP